MKRKLQIIFDRYGIEIGGAIQHKDRRFEILAFKFIAKIDVDTFDILKKKHIALNLKLLKDGISQPYTLALRKIIKKINEKSIYIINKHQWQIIKRLQEKI